MRGGERKPVGRTSFDDELYSFERWRSEQGLHSAGLGTRPSRESTLDMPSSAMAREASVTPGPNHPRWGETPDIDEIDRRLTDCEARLRREWETLRDLYEEPLRLLKERYLPALDRY